MPGYPEARAAPWAPRLLLTLLFCDGHGALGGLLAGVDVGAQVAYGGAAGDGLVHRGLGVQPVGQHAAQVHDAAVLAQQRVAAGGERGGVGGGMGGWRWGGGTLRNAEMGGGAERCWKTMHHWGGWVWH